MCGTNRHAVAHGREQFFCNKCKGLYDGEPAEGGDYSDRNPALRMEREERRREQGSRRRY